jgi:hypothetical protein
VLILEEGESNQGISWNRSEQIEKKKLGKSVKIRKSSNKFGRPHNTWKKHRIARNSSEKLGKSRNISGKIGRVREGGKYRKLGIARKTRNISAKFGRVRESSEKSENIGSSE